MPKEEFRSKTEISILLKIILKQTIWKQEQDAGDLVSEKEVLLITPVDSLFRAGARAPFPNSGW